MVVTHHLPHPRSIHPRFADDALTPAFCSDLRSWLKVRARRSGCMAIPTRVATIWRGNAGRVQSEGLWACPAGGRYENAKFDAGLIVEI